MNQVFHFSRPQVSSLHTPQPSKNHKSTQNRGAPVNRNALDAFQSFLEQFPGTDEREAQILLAARSECRPGDSRHPGLFQQKLLYFFRGEPRIFDVYPRVECTIWRLAAKSGNLIEPGDKLIPPFAV